ncbi:replication endonuclease [Pectobacterium aroidearum]|nr:replication endonuclease [Pectobacterium aroidearum]MDY4387743.1 replication endonuclease [Pectobacterium aroidearum]
MIQAAEHNGDYHAVLNWQREQFAAGVPDGVGYVERILWHMDKTDHDWRHPYFADLPDYLAKYFGQRYETLFKSDEHKGRRRANTFLRRTLGESVLPRLRKIMPRYQTEFLSAGDIPFPFSDDLEKLPTFERDDIRRLSTQLADFMAASFKDYTERGIQNATDLDMRSITLLAFRHLGRLTLQAGTQPPYWAQFTKGRRELPTHSAESGLLRMMSPEWWRVRIKRRRDLQREHMAIAVGQVQKAASAYVSRSTLGEWIAQKKRNREFFKAFDLQSRETGERVSMNDMVNGSNANPAIRRCELMVRMRGFEDLANEMGCAGEFYTITAPSKYHSAHSGGGFVKQWNGASPRDTQKYLCSVWAKIRAALSREEISVFGFRVVEPHHDGTPHWHMLLFMPPEHVDQVRDIMCYYARYVDSTELQSEQALKARFHVEPIDPAKGSATGYIAKYISKNIDGFALDDENDDETGESLKDMSKAVSAWASRWRIRQFQQIGGAPVTVYRELRRLRDIQLDDARMDAVLAAADVGDWGAYTQAQGGALVSRDNLVVRLAYEITEQGNQYAEDVQRVQGVYSPLLGAASEVVTRSVKWNIVPKLATAPAEAGFAVDLNPAWSSVNNCTQGNRRRLSELLKQRGFSGENEQVSILLRGGNLSIGEDRMLRIVNEQLNEYEKSTDWELWDGWNW